jgi:glycosyltransferase involved in cell wall biosynthesis
MNTAPVVSVIVAAFNASRWIGMSLDSARAQTLREIEIIVVDDGSVDDTPAVVAEFARRDPRIRLIRQENSGVGAARNTGIRNARGEFIATLDADDLWTPTKLEKQVRRIGQCGERTAMVYCWYQHVDEQGDGLGSHFPFTVEGEARRAIILRNFLGNASVPLFRAVSLRQTGLYLTREEQGGVQGCEDWDLSIRVAETWEVGVVQEVLVGYRQSDSCMSLGAAGMAASFRVVMDRARLRNPDLPAALFRWAEGHFQSYLVSKSYGSCDYRLCLAAVARAVRCDPVLILNWSLHKMTIKSFVWLVSGKRRSLPHRERRVPAEDVAAGNPLPADKSLLGRVQERRWTQVVERKA